jgi:16S rRNA (guanine527-N7)-methyltransferase
MSVATSAALPEPLTAEGFQAETGVSRETLERLQRYAAALIRWQARINLVAPATLPDLWRRHMLDSAQLLQLVPAGTRRLIDLGSGAGFPGLVLAILGVPEVHLVEADSRKCAFLREAARLAVAANVIVHNRRIEAMPAEAFEVVTARALAPLAELLKLASRFAGPGTVFLFPKGRGLAEELITAPETATMRAERIASRTDPGAAILKLEPEGT